MADLNRLNDLSNFIKHLREHHKDIKAAIIAAKRLEQAKDNLKMSEHQLFLKAGALNLASPTPDGENEVEVRAMPADMDDAFEPEFELDSEEHSAWLDEMRTPS